MEVANVAVRFNRMLDLRERMDDKLRASESRFRNIIEASPVPCALNDEHQNITYLNAAFVRTFGYDRRDIRTLADWWPKAYPDAAYRQGVLTTWQARLEEMKQTGAKFKPLELDIRCKDGTVRAVVVAAEPLEGSFNGEHLVVLYDITDRKRTEDALRASEERLRLFVEHAPAGIAMFDTDMHYLSLSRRWRADYRLGEQDLIGCSHYDVFPDLPERWKEIHRRCLAGAIEHGDEDRFPRADGATDWVRWEVRPWHNGAGAIGGVIIFSELITERVRAGAELREQKARLEALTRRLLNVQEAERRAIARELHDEVGGVLTAIKLNLQSLRGGRSAATSEAALADGVALVDGAIRSVRSISVDLRPTVLDDLGLIPALKWYCERQAQRSGTPIALALDALDLKRAPQLESACFRIVQESITNVLRHAGARHVRVALRRGDVGFELEIADDGAGFDAGAMRRSGNAGEHGGLVGMEERTRLLGGRFAVVTAPGSGTRVLAQFPLPEAGFG
jgi:PAS domain S-box-containing protein